MTFFFDNCIPIKLAKCLRIVEFEIVHLQDMWPDIDYPEGVEDTAWVPEIGKLGYVVVSGDQKLTSRPAEVRALLRAKLVVYLIYSGFTGQPIVEQARWFLKWWSDIEHHALKVGARGHAYLVRSDGKIVEKEFRNIK